MPSPSFRPTGPAELAEMDRHAFPRIRLGVSACLLGERVRYDGGHKRHALLTGTLAAHVDYVPLCPEAGIGMGVPRPPIHLVADAARPRALGLDDPTLDVTIALEAFGAQQLNSLKRISGYIFKKNSPSCGLHGVKLFAHPGRGPRRSGTGIFARVVRDALPLLPMAEEDELDDPQRRDNFLCRVYVYRRWQDLLAAGPGHDDLSRFHAAHSFLVMAHSRAAHARLEKLLGSADAAPAAETAERYIRELMTALARNAQRAQHCSVLSQLADELATGAGKPGRADPALAVEGYATGKLSLIRAIRILRAHAARRPDTWLEGQVYLYPYPDALRCEDY